MASNQDVGRAADAEVWRPVPGYEKLYEVSDHGAVRSLRLTRGDGLIKGCVLNGYRRVLLCRDGAKTHAAVHRLVCVAFHGPQPVGHEVGHLDGTRNNNRADNLKWVTRSENMLHASAHGTLFRPVCPGHRRRRGPLNPQYKYDQSKRDAVRSLAKDGKSGRMIARLTGVSEAHVRRILSEKSHG